MPADALVYKVSRASAGMVLIYLTLWDRQHLELLHLGLWSSSVEQNPRYEMQRHLSWFLKQFSMFRVKISTMIFWTTCWTKPTLTLFTFTTVLCVWLRWWLCTSDQIRLKWGFQLFSGCYLCIRQSWDCLYSVGSFNSPILQIPQCIRQISHNAPICNRNFYKVVYGGIWEWCIVGFVNEVKSPWPYRVVIVHVFPKIYHLIIDIIAHLRLVNKPFTKALRICCLLNSAEENEAF